RLMGSTDWQHSKDVVFPLEVLDLFVGDVVQHIVQPHTAAARSGVASDGTEVVHLEVARMEVAPVVNAPSSADANFFETILSTVFNALKLDPGAVADWVSGKLGGGALGTIVGVAFGWLASAWNRAVELARTATETFLTQLAQPAINLLRLAIGAVATFTT